MIYEGIEKKVWKKIKDAGEMAQCLLAVLFFVEGSFCSSSLTAVQFQRNTQGLPYLEVLSIAPRFSSQSSHSISHPL